MDATQRSRLEKKKELLKQLAELEIDEMVEQGVFLETPHYSIIERQAMTLGRELSRQAQERAAREVAASCDGQVACPTCQAPCQTETTTTGAASIDGRGRLTEAKAHCRKCRRSFFPSARGNGTR